MHNIVFIYIMKMY